MQLLHLTNQCRVPRRAGLGVFFCNINSSTSSSIYIKATLKDCTSVLMAEAAALALAAQIASTLGIHDPIFLSDNQQLVAFLNGTDHDHPPDWSIKSLTQSFMNGATVNNAKIFKIHRNLILANQSFRSMSSHSSQLQTICNNAAHVNSCPVKTAIQSVIGDLYSNIAARCC